MKWLDKLTERNVRSMAQRSSRRGFIATLGAVVAGDRVPARVARAAADRRGRPSSPEPPAACVLSCYNCGRFRTQRRSDVNPLLAIIITAVLAFGAHVLLTLALRSK